MLDSLLGLAVVGLPTVLSVVGVVVSLKVPHAKHHRLWYASLILAGFLISSLTLWQQSRSTLSHAAEVSALNDELKGLREQVSGLRQETAALTQSQQTEITRRQQAEKDLQNFVSAVGSMTRQGVMADIKNSPIRVEVNGRPTRDPAEIKRVRVALGELMRIGAHLRDRCRADAADSSLEADANKWYSGAQVFLRSNLDSSFATQFTTQKSTAFTPSNVPEHRVPLWLFLDQRIETLSKFIDQLK